MRSISSMEKFSSQAAIRDEECKTNFKVINDFYYTDKIKKTFKFIRAFRREDKRILLPPTGLD